MTENTSTGQVQWFDHKKGYGFVKVLNPESGHAGEEVFLHFSEIKCDSNFKKVFPGEIVSLSVEKKPGDESKLICTNVCGVYGSTLLIDNEQYIYRIRLKNMNNDSEGNVD